MKCTSERTCAFFIIINNSGFVIKYKCWIMLPLMSFPAFGNYCMLINTFSFFYQINKYYFNFTYFHTKITSLKHLYISFINNPVLWKMYVFDSCNINIKKEMFVLIVALLFCTQTKFLWYSLYFFASHNVISFKMHM